MSLQTTEQGSLALGNEDFMGDIRIYSCDCGYSERVFAGTGRRGIDEAYIKSVFGLDREMLEAPDHNIESFYCNNMISICKNCNRIIALPRLNYRLLGSKDKCIIKHKCPHCGDEKEKENLDLQDLSCPKCGKNINFIPGGFWD